MREDGVHQVFFGRLKLTAHDIALDKLRHFGADHMRAQKFARLRVKHRFDHSLRFAQGNGFAVTDEREFSDLDVIAQLFGLGFGIANACHLRVTVGAARDAFRLYRVGVQTFDQLRHHHTFMACFVGEPWSACDVTDCIETVDPSAAELIRHDMRPVDGDTKLLKTQPFDITNDTDG